MQKVLLDNAAPLPLSRPLIHLLPRRGLVQQTLTRPDPGVTKTIEALFCSPRTTQSTTEMSKWYKKCQDAQPRGGAPNRPRESQRRLPGGRLPELIHKERKVENDIPGGAAGGKHEHVSVIVRPPVGHYY